MSVMPKGRCGMARECHNKMIHPIPGANRKMKSIFNDQD